MPWFDHYLIKAAFNTTSLSRKRTVSNLHPQKTNVGFKGQAQLPKAPGAQTQARAMQAARMGDEGGDIYARQTVTHAPAALAETPHPMWDAKTQKVPAVQAPEEPSAPLLNPMRGAPAMVGPWAKNPGAQARRRPMPVIKRQTSNTPWRDVLKGSAAGGLGGGAAGVLGMYANSLDEPADAGLDQSPASAPPAPAGGALAGPRGPTSEPEEAK